MQVSAKLALDGLTIGAMLSWRSHPILFAAVAGAVIGAVNSIVVELGGVLRQNNKAVLLLLWPSAQIGPGADPSTVVQTGFLLLFEFGANVLIYAALLALPVALVVGVRRAFRGRRRPESNESKPAL